MESQTIFCLICIKKFSCALVNHQNCFHYNKKMNILLLFLYFTKHVRFINIVYIFIIIKIIIISGWVLKSYKRENIQAQQNI